MGGLLRDMLWKIILIDFLTTDGGKRLILQAHLVRQMHFSGRKRKTEFGDNEIAANLFRPYPMPSVIRLHGNAKCPENRPDHAEKGVYFRRNHWGDFAKINIDKRLIECNAGHGKYFRFGWRTEFHSLTPCMILNVRFLCIGQEWKNMNHETRIKPTLFKWLEHRTGRSRLFIVPNISLHRISVDYQYSVLVNDRRVSRPITESCRIIGLEPRDTIGTVPDVLVIRRTVTTDNEHEAVVDNAGMVSPDRELSVGSCLGPYGAIIGVPDIIEI